MMSVSALPDHELLDAATTLAHQERSATAALIRVLAEIDVRSLYRPLGFSCLYYYCTDALHLSEDGACRRIEVARVSRIFPVVLDALEEGALTLTTAVMLGPHLTPANVTDLLAASRFKSKRDVERILAARNTGGDARSFTLHFKVDADTYDRFEYARSLLRHRIPDGDRTEVLKLAIELLIADVERRKLAVVRSPRAPSGRMPRGRGIPSHVQRAVWQRDAGRCAFQGTMGRCRERDFLEFHHVQPYAEGGEATVDNIQLRCRAHNAYEAALMFQA